MKLVLCCLMFCISGLAADEAEIREACTDEAAGQCFLPLLNFVRDDFDEIRECETLAEIYDCMREKALKCLRNQNLDDLKSDLEPLRKLVEDRCIGGDIYVEEDDAEYESMKECMMAEEEYIFECKDRIDGDDDLDVCSEIQAIEECMVGRAYDKCGSLARDAIQQDFEERKRKEDC